MDQSTRPAARLLRLSQIIKPNGPIPVGKTTWWAGVRDGRFPAPVKIGPRITAWRSDDIAALISTLSDNRPTNDSSGDKGVRR